jgi:integrase
VYKDSMAHRRQLPKDTSVHFNPYPTKRGVGKFFLAKIGKKLTGSKKLVQRFEKKGDAERWIHEQVQVLEERIIRHGEAAAELDPVQYSSALLASRTLGECASSTMTDLAELYVASQRPKPAAIRNLTERLKKLGNDPLEVVDRALTYFFAHCPDPENQRTVRQAFERWLSNKAGRPVSLLDNVVFPRPKRRKRKAGDNQKQRTSLSAYLRGMKATMRIFAEQYADFPFHAVNVDMAQTWLNGLDAKANSKRHYRKDLLTIWNWGVERMRYAKVNPWLGVEPPNADPLAIGILQPQECLRLLVAASSNPKYIRLLARLVCCLFAGIRTAEVKRLRWEHIRLNTRKPVITVEASVAKTKHRRVVHLSRSAVAWLRLVPKELTNGRVGTHHWDELFGEMRRSVGVTKFPRNCLRHSFASYHASIHGEVKTAEQLGHTDLKTIKEHYQELVMPELADAFWMIGPGTTEVDIQKMLAAA